MNKINYRRLKVYFVILLGIILFTTGLFWEGGPKPTWAQQGPPGTVPPAPTADPGNDDEVTLPTEFSNPLRDPADRRLPRMAGPCARPAGRGKCPTSLRWTTPRRWPSSRSPPRS